MTVLRAALLFDHPTTRLFASRILESFFSLLPSPFSSFFLLPSHASASVTIVVPSFRDSSTHLARPSRASPLYVLFCYGPFVPDLSPLPSPLPLFHGPVPSFRASRLLSGSSVNKRTRAKEESKAFRVFPPPFPSVVPSTPPPLFPLFLLPSFFLPRC